MPAEKAADTCFFFPVEVDDDRSDQGNDDNTVCAEDDRQDPSEVRNSSQVAESDRGRQDPSEVRNSSQVAESDRGHNGKAVPQGVCKLASFFYD